MTKNPAVPGALDAEALKSLRLPDFPDLRAIMLAFGFRSVSGARRAAIRGDFGPYFFVGKKIHFRRASVEDALRRREIGVPLRLPRPISTVEGER